MSHPPDTLVWYTNRSRSGCCGHTEAAPSRAEVSPGAAGGPGLQGRGGRPGCAETDRAQRAATRPQRPKTVVRRRRGRGPAKPGSGAENAKTCPGSPLCLGGRPRRERGGEQENGEYRSRCRAGSPSGRPAAVPRRRRKPPAPNMADTSRTSLSDGRSLKTGKARRPCPPPAGLLQTQMRRAAGPPEVRKAGRGPPPPTPPSARTPRRWR